MDQRCHIRVADFTDIPAIFRIADTNSLERSESPSTQGFLVSEFSRDRYLQLCKLTDHFYVIEEANGVAGFLLAYSSHLGRDIDSALEVIEQVQASPFILARQICVESGCSGRGHGQELYRRLFREQPILPTVAAIVLDPLNARSMRFHERLGFRRCGEMTPLDGRRRGIWRGEAEWMISSCG